MKNSSLFVLLLTLCLLSTLKAQNVPSGAISINPVYHPADLIYSKTNYTGTTLDTTAYLPIPFYSELGYLIVSTDSAVFDVYFDGKNSSQSGVTTTYADSLKTTVNAGAAASILIKGPGTWRLPNENLIRFRVAARVTGNGTTAGRTLKIYRTSKAP